MNGREATDVHSRNSRCAEVSKPFSAIAIALATMGPDNQRKPSTWFFARTGVARGSAGYTIDQTILIVAIIAILITLIIITVGWQLINRTGGTKLAGQMKQVEDANGQFYAAISAWPMDAYSAPAATALLNVLALANSSAVTTWTGAAAIAASRKNYISAFKENGTTSVYYDFGMGTAGTIQQQKATVASFNGGAIGEFIIIQFSSVPFSQAKEAELTIDGKLGTPNYGAGRFVATSGSTINCISGAAATYAAAATADGTVVNVCYAGNAVR